MSDLYKVNMVVSGSLSDIAKIKDYLGDKVAFIEVTSTTDQTYGMHETQVKLLSLIEKMGIDKVKALNLRHTGELINVNHPQKVKHHIEQLKKKGLWIAR